MPINTDLARYPETGHCLLPSGASREWVDRLREDTWEAILAVKANPLNKDKLARWHRDFASELHMKCERVAAFLRAEPFLSLIGNLIGTDADLCFTSTMTKTAEKDAHLDWHQDAAYGPYPEHLKLSFWIALTDSRRDNGCLRIIPGSHLGGLVPHIPSKTLELDKEIETVDESTAEDVEMEAGAMLLIDRFLFHSSRRNDSGRLRMGLLAGFMSPKAEYQEFEKKGSYRYLRLGRPVWSRVIDPA